MLPALAELLLQASHVFDYSAPTYVTITSDLSEATSLMYRMHETQSVRGRDDFVTEVIKNVLYAEKRRVEHGSEL